MPFFIAEVSSNHSKSIERSLEFIDVAASIGCDSVKFQLLIICLNCACRKCFRLEWNYPTFPF